MSQEKQIVVGLAGNPNAGKTSLFNKLTGLRAHVANYPGVTVEQKWGEVKHKGRTIKVVDLPGSYSLNSYSLDERLARDYLINERPDLVVNVVDTTNLERNLYLTMQFLELGLPTVLALNMMDLSTAQGITIDIPRLETDLGVSAIPIVATSGKGIEALLDKIIEIADAPHEWEPLEIGYGLEIGEAISSVEALTQKSSLPLQKLPSRWLTLKFLEGDAPITELFTEKAPEVAQAAGEIRKKLAWHLRTTLDDDLEGVMTDYRYGFLSGLCRTVVTFPRKEKKAISDTIDKVLLNRVLAPIFFLLGVYGLYEFTFWASAPVSGWLETFFGFLGELAENKMSDGLLKDLVIEGLIGGVGGVLGFAPLIAFMFLGISILEDSGYMARVAFILDRIFRACGLHGNSVVALIVSGGIAGGCAIPGVMATRTLRDPKERIATILVAPFMTCGAKVPVFLMLVAAFFSEYQALVMLGLTILAWVVALVSAKILRMYVLPGKPTPFVLELPPYRLPTVLGVLLHALERTWLYVKKAGTVIVGITILIWLTMTFPKLPEEQMAVLQAPIEVASAQLEEANTSQAAEEEITRIQESINQAERATKLEELSYSVAGRIGKTLEPVSQLIGFDWRTNIALVGGFAAKEVFLATLGTTYAMAEVDDEEALSESLSTKIAADPAWSPLVAISLMVFVLIYAPCFVTIAVIYREIGAKWATVSLVGSTVYAYIICLVLYQGGKFLGLG